MRKNIIIVFLFLLFPFLGEAQNPIEKINYLILTQKYTEALQLTNEFVRDNPENPAGYYQQALINKLMYKYPDAIKSIRNALDKEPENIDYITEYATLLMKREREKEAVELFEQAYSQDSTHIYTGLNLGNYYLKTKEYERAQKILYTLYINDTTNSYLARNLGLCSIKLLDKENSLKWLKRALFLDSTDIKAYEYLALVYRSVEEFDEALACLNKATNVAPHNKSLYIKIGDIHVLRNHNYQAIPSYLEALAIDPKDDFVVKSLGLSYYKIKKYNQSIHYLKKALSMGMKDLQCYIHLGKIYTHNNKLDTANIYFSEALELLKPDNNLIFSVKENMGKNFYSKGEYAKAINQFDQIIKLELKEGYWETYRKNKVIIDIASIYHEKLEDKMKAIEYYEKVIKPEVMVNKNYYDYAQTQIKKLKEELFFEGAL
ncbi:MAG: tetratricopeptide repeat protein [Bacteroidota bacterium]